MKVFSGRNRWKQTQVEKYRLWRRTYSKKTIQRNREFVNRFKCKPCMDCGTQYNPWVMDFDHRDPSQKKGNIAKMVLRYASLKVLKEEIEKCDLVCANCHRERTHRQKF